MQQSIYDPGFVAFGGGSTSTVVHPVTMAAVAVVVVLIFLLPRKYLAIPVFLGLLLIPSGQNFYLSGFHLYLHRVVVLAGCVRMLWSGFSAPGKLLAGGFGTLDKVFIAWAIVRVFGQLLQFMDLAAVPNQVGFLWEAIGGYFLFRWLIQDAEDVQRVLKAFAVVALVAATGMIYEQVTLQNLFGFLGGIGDAPVIRNGKIRSQGIFQHALLAGSFGATMFPMFLWLWKRGQSWFFWVLGGVSCLVMVFAASTSTPIMALLGGILAICFWPLRDWMRPVRWGIVLLLVGLHIVMKAPVWFLMDHIDLSGGSTGYHRAMLIDQSIKHFGEWWLFGTHNNANWDWDMWDTANQFITEALAGGIVTFILFIVMFVLCFRMIGNARKAVEGDRKKQWQFWLLGAALFTQVMAYFGIDYFDQMKYVWYSLLVMIPAITMNSVTVPEPADETSVGYIPLYGVRSPAAARTAIESTPIRETRSHAPASKWLSH